MPNYLFVYRSVEDTSKEFSPEEIQQFMQLWTDWINEGFQKGWLVDPGDGLQTTGKMVSPDKVVTDGPFAETKEIVGGFSVVKADSADAAAEIAKSCPALVGGGTVEVREMAGMAPPKE